MRHRLAVKFEFALGRKLHADNIGRARGPFDSRTCALRLRRVKYLDAIRLVSQSVAGYRRPQGAKMDVTIKRGHFVIAAALTIGYLVTQCNANGEILYNSRSLISMINRLAHHYMVVKIVHFTINVDRLVR